MYRKANKAKQNELKCVIPLFENVQRMTAEEFEPSHENK